MRNAIRFTLFCLPLCLAVSGWAQSTNSGDLRGTVTDPTGALLPGVTVTVLNVDTGVSKDYVTNQDGIYDTSSILSGTYKITFADPGFATLVRGPLTVITGVTPVNVKLSVGSAATQVLVTTNVPLLDTETGSQTSTLESDSMDQLPQVSGATGEDWQNFMILLPGTSGTVLGSQGSSNPGQVVSSDGNLPYSNILADGASTTLSHSQNANPAIFDTVAELQVSLSSFSAQYGIGGMIINQISKGGTNHFHGSAYDYIENNAFNAAEYGFGNSVPVPFIRFHDFGGSVGGPILKKKMFFFFDYDQIVDHGSASNSTNTIPTADVMNGIFTGQREIFDPTTQTMGVDSKGNPYPIRQSFASEYGNGNAIPSTMFDSVASKFQQWYPTSSSHIAGGKFVAGTLNSTGLLQNNFFSSLPQSTPYRRYFGRLDYDITPNNRLTMSDTQSDTPVIYPNSVTACPIGCQAGDVDNNNAQVSDVWNISSRTINEARIGYTDQLNFFADLSLGKGYPSQLGWQFAEADTIPAIQFTNTYPYAWIDPSSNAVYKEHVFDPSDVVTMIRGKHILHFGGELLMYRDDSTAWGNTNAGTFQFSGQYTQNWTVDPGTGVASPDTTTGLEYADFLLGLAQNWSAGVTPEYGGRLKSPQMFIQDDYKIRPNLTLNLGLRYQINHGWNEVHGNEDSFDPTLNNPASNTKGAEWYGSTHANGRTSLQANVFSTWLPRVGFSWMAIPNTTVRGGFGLYSYNWSLDTYGGGMGGPFGASGGTSDQTNGITPITQLDGSGTIYGTANALPYTTASTDPTRFNGQGVNYNEYHTPVPKIYQWNFAIQRQLSANFVAEVSYIASHGFNLNFPTDLNQVPQASLASSDTQFRPYPVYQGIGGSTNNAISNYNSLQAEIKKRFTSGLSMDANYVWSHFLDDADSSGWGSRAGQQPYQIANSPSANYSNSNFDVRNAFKGYVVYQLPFGKGARFLNNNALADAVIGGWEIAGGALISSGNPYTVYSTQNTYALAGSAFPNWSGTSATPKNKSINNWYNPAAFSLPANGTFGNVRRNSLYGPGIDQENLSASKSFSLPYEGIKLQIRGDASNAFNHPSFGVPQTNLTGASGVGQPFTSTSNITSTTVGGRTIQISGRVTF